MSGIYESSDKKFNNWQSSMKKKCNDFKKSVDKLQDTPTKISYFDVFDKDENCLDDEIENKHAIEIVTQEISYLEKELENIISLISLPKYKNNQRVKKMITKITRVKDSILMMKEKAYSIRNQYHDDSENDILYEGNVVNDF